MQSNIKGAQQQALPLIYQLPLHHLKLDHSDDQLKVAIMGFVSLIMFLGLFTFGHDTFQWYDPEGHVQLAIFASFVFGIVCGLKVAR